MFFLFSLRVHFKGVRSPAVLLVADLFGPGRICIGRFHYRRVSFRHCLLSILLRGCRGSMPVFLTRRDPDNITLPDFLDLAAPLLNPAGASRHDQYLPDRVGVPCCPSARLNRDEGTGRA